MPIPDFGARICPSLGGYSPPTGEGQMHPDEGEGEGQRGRDFEFTLKINDLDRGEEREGFRDGEGQGEKSVPEAVPRPFSDPFMPGG